MNMTLTRVNQIGLQYKIVGNTEGISCDVTCETNGEKLTIFMNIDRLSQCWYNWQMKDEFVQKAFHPLPADQREFLMSGITPTKWKEMFGDDDENQEEGADNNGDTH